MNNRFIIFPLLLVTLLSHATLWATPLQITHRGLTLNADLVAAAGAKPGQTVVLMTHGTLAHGQMEIMTSLQGALKERGISSLSHTLSLGLSDRSGMYDCAVPHTHQHTDALDEIGLWLSWLQEQGVEKIVLLGHSRGGNQSAWFAAERDQPAIRGSILIAPMLWSAGYDEQDYKKRYQTPLTPLLQKAQRLVAEGKGETMLEGLDFIYCKGTQATAAAFASYYSAETRRDTPSLLPRLAKPVLLFAGSDDQVVPGLGERVTPLADGKKIQFSLIDGADHFFRDLYAEEIADRIVEFMESL